MSENKYGFEGRAEFDAQGLELKISSLKKGIEAIRKIVVELEQEKSSAEESQVEKLDTEIARYRQTLELNESELEQLQADLLSHPDSGGETKH